MESLGGGGGGGGGWVCKILQRGGKEEEEGLRGKVEGWEAPAGGGEN